MKNDDKALVQTRSRDMRESMFPMSTEQQVRKFVDTV